LEGIPLKKFLSLIFILTLISTALAAEEKPTITVFDFQYSEALTDSEMTSIISLLSSELFKTGLYTVIDIQQRDNLMSEMQFSLSGATDEENLLKLGKLLSAESIVTGKIGTVGGRMVLNAKMLETETARIQSTADGVYSDIEQLLDDISNIAAELSGQAVEETRTTSEQIESTELSEVEKGTVKGNKTMGFATLGLGVVMIGSGSYFMFDSIDKLNTVKDAEEAYLNATTNFTPLYEDYQDAYNAAENSNTLFFVGAGLIGGGIASSLLSLVFFSDDTSQNDAVSVMLLPGDKSTILQLGFSY